MDFQYLSLYKWKDFDELYAKEKYDIWESYAFETDKIIQSMIMINSFSLNVDSW